METPKERLDYIMDWIKRNPEKFKATQKRYQELHKDEIQKRRKETYELRKGDLNAKIRERRRIDPEFVKRTYENGKKWREKNPQKEIAYRQKYGTKTYHKHKERYLDQMHKHLVNKRLEVLYWYSDGKMECAHCGEKHVEFLVPDHIENNGRFEKKLYKGNLILNIIANKFPEGYQILCHNCNTVKESTLKKRKNPNAAYHKSRSKVRWNMLYKYSHGTMKCECCGNDVLSALTFHHVNGGGSKHVRSIKLSLPQWLKKFSPPLSEFQVLCQNCNSSLGHYGYCPHHERPQ